MAGPTPTGPSVYCLVLQQLCYLVFALWATHCPHPHAPRHCPSLLQAQACLVCIPEPSCSVVIGPPSYLLCHISQIFQNFSSAVSRVIQKFIRLTSFVYSVLSLYYSSPQLLSYVLYTRPSPPQLIPVSSG